LELVEGRGELRPFEGAVNGFLAFYFKLNRPKIWSVVPKHSALRETVI
jgi:hypothetical protein